MISFKIIQNLAVTNCVTPHVVPARTEAHENLFFRCCGK